jgi:hypothetical protein
MPVVEAAVLMTPQLMWLVRVEMEGAVRVALPQLVRAQVVLVRMVQLIRAVVAVALVVQAMAVPEAQV